MQKHGKNGGDRLAGGASHVNQRTSGHDDAELLDKALEFVGCTPEKQKSVIGSLVGQGGFRKEEADA